MDQTPKRQPSKPEIAELDRTPWSAEKQRRFDQPKRTTLTDLPAAHPPERKRTLGGMPAPAAPNSAPPPPPRLPGELAPTRPAPNPLQRQTIQRPAPPSAVALARRTDPPRTAETPIPESPSSGRAEDRERILEAELAKQRARVAELERQARVLVESKSPAASYPPPVTPAPRAPTPKVETPAIVVPETFRGVTLTQAKIGFLVGLTAVLTPLAGYIAWQMGQLQSGKDRTAVQANQAATEAQSAKVGTSANDKELAALRAKLCDKDALYREVWRRQGVVVPADEGDCAAPALKQTTPLRKPGEIKPGPTLILEREQPP